MKKIAIIGSGVSGLGCAYSLRENYHLTIFESEDRLGGHAQTVDVCVDEKRYGVDTGFLVYNERTYPQLIRLFDELKVKVAPSEMSFSVSRRDVDREWCGSSLSSLFAQPSNLLSPRFWSMVGDILRFNSEATALALQVFDEHDPTTKTKALSEPLGQFLERRGYGSAFREDYLLPMAAAIWSCPISTMASFPLGSFVRFFHNHGLLQITRRPQWFTCEGGSKNYVRALAKVLTEAGHHLRVNSKVLQVSRTAGYVDVLTKLGRERFDGVVMACHSDQALRLLDTPSLQEEKVLRAIEYQENIAYLHTDESLMPRRRRAWAAWNYLCERSPNDSADNLVSVTYWLNRLQPLPFKTNLFVSLNPVALPKEGTVLQKMTYAHPVFDTKANLAQREITSLQGLQKTWYAGAWCGFGFHEDGLKSGIDAAARLHAHIESEVRESRQSALAA
jgi:uncharacterized protein